MKVPKSDDSPPESPENPNEIQESVAFNSTVEIEDDGSIPESQCKSDAVGPNSDESPPENPNEPEESLACISTVEDEDDGSTTAGDGDGDSDAVDISCKIFDFSIEGKSNDPDALYFYKNKFNLLPNSIGPSHKRLRTLRFFRNEINLFSPPSGSGSSESGLLEGLESLKVTIPSPELGGLPLSKMGGLKELELSKARPWASGFQILGEISGLRCLTKLSVCHYSISHLPPEIGCLSNLEHLDLSFNQMKSLPAEIGNLNALVCLIVSSNQLVQLPSTLSCLERLENLDLSNNMLTSLGPVNLCLMRRLQNLNLQYNKLLTCFRLQLPSWVRCDLEENGKDSLDDNLSSCTAEIDVYESPVQKSDESLSSRGFSSSSTSVSNGNKRARKPGRFWKQKRARQSSLKNGRNCKGLDPSMLLHLKEDGECKSGNINASESCPEVASEIVKSDGDNGDGGKDVRSRECQSGNVLENIVYLDMSLKKEDEDEEYVVDKEDCCESDAPATTPKEVFVEEDEGSSSDTLKRTSNIQGHSDRDHGGKKRSRTPSDTCTPSDGSSKKCRQEDSSNLSRKYSNTSFCSNEDELPDGFYDAGRDRPFKLLTSYEKNFHLDSREVLLVDKTRDEELDATLISAQALVSNFITSYGLHSDKDQVDAAQTLQIASLLAHFVSDHFGGSDRGAVVKKTRNAVASRDEKPFICTCQTGIIGSVSLSTKPAAESFVDISVSDLCEKSVRCIKARRNSMVVPIGKLQFGVCRHRALLMKYICDRVTPQVPCELVRGYLDFMPHAWNVIVIKKGDSQIRMLVDACHPLYIRKETDPEYYCRYIPISRAKVSLSSESSLVPTSSFPTLPFSDGTLKECVKSLIRCKYESDEAVAKVRTLKVHGTSMEEIRNFEYNCVGEVRILAALKHPCIVEMYGHRIRSKWVRSKGVRWKGVHSKGVRSKGVRSKYGGHEHRILQSEILMEFINGGSLLNYIKKLSKAGEKHVPLELALCIAKDVACALCKVHSMHIIHRDVKSDNILIDLDRTRDDGTPVVKLCDFDSAVPLRSYLHKCCIAHVGAPPAYTCVGTPRWMAPEVYRAVHEPNIYGLEVDIWSFGCLLLEMLTLQIPYQELSEVEIHDLLERGKRPKLTDDLEAFRSLEEPVMTQEGTEDADLDTLRFLVDLFLKCTEEDPQNRPTADNLYELLLEHSSTLTNSIV